MKIFLIGFSGLGKSPLAQKLVEQIADAQHIKAGEWVRSQFPPGTSVEKLTQASLDQLRHDPDVCVNYIRKNYHLEEDQAVFNSYFILDGIRNPRDFVHLFDPRCDLVVFLSRVGIEAQTKFETGCRTIYQYVDWLIRTELLSQQSMLQLYFTTPNKYSKAEEILLKGPRPAYSKWKVFHLEEAVELSELEEAVPVILQRLGK